MSTLNSFSSNKITKTEVPNHRRMAMLLKYFGNHHLRLEFMVYQWMKKLCPSYDGGYWHMFELSNGGFYMALKDNEHFEACCFGGCEDGVELSGDAAGLTAFLYAVNQLANDTEDEDIIKLYYLIRDYAFVHDEAKSIEKVID